VVIGPGFTGTKGGKQEFLEKGSRFSLVIITAVLIKVMTLAANHPDVSLYW